MDAVLIVRGPNFGPYRYPLGDGPPVITGGGANWEEVARPERDPLTDFVGNSLITVDVPVLFNGWPRENVGPEVRQVLDLARGWRGNRPPHFIAEGPFPYSGHDFVMRIPEMGPSLLSDGGALVRQAMTLKLLEWQDPAKVRFRRHGKHSGPARPPGLDEAMIAPTSIRLKRSENLLEVEHRYRGGDAFGAKALGEINGIRDIMKKLPKGTKIYLPPSRD